MNVFLRLSEYSLGETVFNMNICEFNFHGVEKTTNGIFLNAEGMLILKGILSLEHALIWHFCTPIFVSKTCICKIKFDEGIYFGSNYRPTKFCRNLCGTSLMFLLRYINADMCHKYIHLKMLYFYFLDCFQAV